MDRRRRRNRDAATVAATVVVAGPLPSGVREDVHRKVLDRPRSDHGTADPLSTRTDPRWRDGAFHDHRHPDGVSADSDVDLAQGGTDLPPGPLPRVQAYDDAGCQLDALPGLESHGRLSGRYDEDLVDLDVSDRTDRQ